MKKYIVGLCFLLLLAGCSPRVFPPIEEGQVVSAPSVQGLRALSRCLRVDLLWDPVGVSSHYEIEWAESPEGPFQKFETPLPMIPLASDVVGEEGVTRYYRVRVVSSEDLTHFGPWSEVVSATSAAFDSEVFLTEVQEAGFRYFHDYAFPGSHLPREGIKAEHSWDPEICSTVSSGMYFFNMAVGIERGFIDRQDAAEHVKTLLKFLEEEAVRFHGTFPHWIHGETGTVIPFSEKDNGADMVETAILAQGLLFAREYFQGDEEVEMEIRERADRLWREIEWDWFVNTLKEKRVMIWHWSPDYGFSDLPIVGFNESEIVYLLGVGSPTHPIDPEVYWEGWVGLNSGFINSRDVEGQEGPISLQLGSGYGFPMFFMHYSYLGLDPRAVPLPEGTLWDEFERQTLAQHDYARLNQNRYKEYDRYWGLTASLDPDGYRAHYPVGDDNGTISPTAAFSSVAYRPEEVIQMMETLYKEKGSELWGPFGFYDAFNPTRDWVAQAYIGIDVGPIGPMIENHRSGKLWEVFMRAPEIQKALKSTFSKEAGARWGLPDDSSR